MKGSGQKREAERKKRNYGRNEVELKSQRERGKERRG